MNVLVRSNDLGIDARRKLTPVQFEEISRWREREEELAPGITRAETVRLAKQILDLDGPQKPNELKLDELVMVSEAAPLLEEKGFRAWPRRNAWWLGRTRGGYEARLRSPVWRV